MSETPRINIPHRLAACLCVIVACGFVSAAQAAGYLDPNRIPPGLLATPHAEGSAEWKREMQAVMDIQKSPDQAEIAAARTEITLAPELFASVLGPDVTATSYPKLFVMLRNLTEDNRQIITVTKAYWNVRRPYVVNKDITVWVEPYNQPDFTTNPSYPSAHTSGATVLAEVLAQLFPDKRDALRARANVISQHRVLAGVHYPMDIEAGKQLALLMLGALWQQEPFRQDFAAAQEEIKQKSKAAEKAQ